MRDNSKPDLGSDVGNVQCHADRKCGAEIDRPRRMAEMIVICPRHGAKDSAIIARSAKKAGDWSAINLHEAERELVHSRPQRSGALRKCKQSPRRRAGPTSTREIV